MATFRSPVDGPLGGVPLNYFSPIDDRDVDTVGAADPTASTGLTTSSVLSQTALDTSGHGLTAAVQLGNEIGVSNDLHPVYTTVTVNLTGAAGERKRNLGLAVGDITGCFGHLSIGVARANIGPSEEDVTGVRRWGGNRLAYPRIGPVSDRF